MKKPFLTLVILSLAFCATAQNVRLYDPESADGYIFTLTCELPVTAVKDQHQSGTCWCYSGLAFLEAELLRMHKGTYDFSEMYLVSRTYNDRAMASIRTGGDVSFGQGGIFTDVLYGMSHYGLVPEECMRPGIMYGDTLSSHAELSALTNAMVSAIAKNDKLHSLQSSPQGGLLCTQAIAAVHDVYLGSQPQRFAYQGREYTPTSFYQSTGLNADDYVCLTSFSHHPFYSQFVLEIPDNWRWSLSYNVPLDDLVAVIDSAIQNGYPVLWGSDVSELGFRMDKGFCVLPATQVSAAVGSDMAHWTGMSAKSIQNEAAKHPTPQCWVTQEERQQAFDNRETGDDHSMLLCGTALDQMGNEYYRVKNSWGPVGPYKGFFYASKAYVRYKTVFIALHKDALPSTLRQQLAIP